MNRPSCPRCGSRSIVNDDGPYCLACSWAKPIHPEYIGAATIPTAIPVGNHRHLPFTQLPHER